MYQVKTDKNGLIDSWLRGRSSTFEDAPEGLKPNNKNEWIKNENGWERDKNEVDRIRKESDDYDYA